MFSGPWVLFNCSTRGANRTIGFDGVSTLGNLPLVTLRVTERDMSNFAIPPANRCSSKIGCVEIRCSRIGRARDKPDKNTCVDQERSVTAFENSAQDTAIREPFLTKI